VGPKNHLVDGGQVWTSPFTAARGDRTATRSFVQILRPLIVLVTFSSWFVEIKFVHRCSNCEICHSFDKQFCHFVTPYHQSLLSVVYRWQKQLAGPCWLDSGSQTEGGKSKIGRNPDQSNPCS